VDHASIAVSAGAEGTTISWAAADRAETYLVSLVTADDRLLMAATAETSHAFAPIPALLVRSASAGDSCRRA